MWTLLIWLAKLITCLIVLQATVVIAYRVLFHPLRHIPGPFVAKISNFYGAYFAWSRTLHHATYRDHQKYGPLLRQGPNKVVFNSAKAIHAARTIPKGYNTWNLTDKDHHRVRRRILGQGLSERAIRQFEPIMLQKIDVFLGNLLKAFRKDEAIETTQACTFLGFDIIFELAYGYNAKLQTSEKVRWLVNGILMANRRINVFLQWPFLKKTKVDKLFTLLLTPQVLRYHKQVFTMIEQRKNQEKHARPDLFSFVSGYKDPETGQGLSNDELFAESILLLPAGGDTTSTTMTSLFYYLSRYLRCYDKLAQEIRSTFQSGKDIKSGATLASCKYLRACIDETLRISPPQGGTLWRQVLRDGVGPVLIDGTPIPEGTNIGVNTYSMHHNEAYFPEPWMFRPERFLEGEDCVCSDIKTAFMPFSFGSRGCAGKPLAYLESSVTVAKTLWYFDLQIPGALEMGKDRDKVFHMLDQFTSHHEGPLLRFKPREHAAADLCDVIVD